MHLAGRAERLEKEIVELMGQVATLEQPDGKLDMKFPMIGELGRRVTALKTELTSLHLTRLDLAAIHTISPRCHQHHTATSALWELLIL